MTDTKRLAQMLRKGSIAIGVMAYPKEAEEAADRIEAQAALIKELAEALRYYEDQFCEGFCDEYPEGFYVSEMDNECSGCRARAALAKAKAVQS
jgi:hypothetical protein